MGGLYGPTGGPGTVYIRDTNQPQGRLLIDAGTKGDGWTPLGLPGSDNFAIPDALVVQGTRTRVQPEHTGLVLEFRSSLIIQNSAVLSVEGSGFEPSQTPLVTAGGMLSISGDYRPTVPLSVTNGGHLNETGSLTLDVPLTLNRGNLQIGGTLLIDAGAELSVAGASSGLTFNVSQLDNRGTLQVQSGTLEIDSIVSQISGTTLTGGDWEVNGGATLNMGGGKTISVNKAMVVLSGTGSTFPQLDGFSSNIGNLSISGGATLATTGDLSNTGSLIVGAGSNLTVTGKYNQSAPATLDIELGGVPASHDYSEISVFDSATLGGALHVAIMNGYIPNAGDRFEVMTFNGEVGSFDSVTGLTAGRTQVLATVLDPTDLVVNSIVNAADLAMGAVTVPTNGIAGQGLRITMG